MDPDTNLRDRHYSYVGRRYYSLTWSCFEGQRLFTERDRVDLVRRNFLRASAETKVSNIAYCFMADHVHQVVRGDEIDSDAQAFIYKAKKYSGYYFKKAFHERLWARKGFNRVLMPGDDPCTAVKYVLGNPVKAGLVTRIEDYPFSGSETLSWRELIDWAYGTIGPSGETRALARREVDLLRLEVNKEPGGESRSTNYMNVSVFKDALLKKRAELEETAGFKPLTDSMEHNNGRQGDMADQAAGNNEVHIQLRLKQTDAKILQAIDEALMRIEKGNFGICKDCGEPIAEARLNAIPWTRVCITCKEKQKA